MAGEIGRPEIGPKRRVGGGEQREIGMVVNPLHLGVRPSASAAFLQADERAIRQVLRGGQNLAVAHHEAKLGRPVVAAVPRLVIVVNVARDLDFDDGLFPNWRGGVRIGGGECGRPDDQNEQGDQIQEFHNCRSRGTP